MNKIGAETEINEICSCLTGEGYSVKFRGFSAIDMYLGLQSLPFLRIETSADIALLARHIENLRFPGVETANGAVDTGCGTCYFRCLDPDEKEQYSFPLLSFAYDWQTGRFQDPYGVYPLLRDLSRKGRKEIQSKREYPNANINSCRVNVPLKNNRYNVIMDAALLLARYGKNAIPGGFPCGAADGEALANDGSPPGPEMQRVFLICLLVSPNPELGFELLKRTGFLETLWPELASFNNVDHSKEFHPEGNVWKHTMETFRYRKANSLSSYELRLSLGLLLHDIGKPITASFGSHRFDGHAEIGARAAARFLERLEFEPSIIKDIFFLVKNHMLPAALKRLPLTKTAEIMSSPLFPTLMELYRCDESSSFKVLDGYHENSAAYQSYLKNLRNPYRSADGKKKGKKEIYLGL